MSYCFFYTMSETDHFSQNLETYWQPLLVLFVCDADRF